MTRLPEFFGGRGRYFSFAPGISPFRRCFPSIRIYEVLRRCVPSLFRRVRFPRGFSRFPTPREFLSALPRVRRRLYRLPYEMRRLPWRELSLLRLLLSVPNCSTPRVLLARCLLCWRRFRSLLRRGRSPATLLPRFKGVLLRRETMLRPMSLLYFLGIRESRLPRWWSVLCLCSPPLLTLLPPRFRFLRFPLGRSLWLSIRLRRL